MSGVTETRSKKPRGGKNMIFVQVLAVPMQQQAELESLWRRLKTA